MLGTVATAVLPSVLLELVEAFDLPLRKSFIATNMPFLARLATLAGFGVTSSRSVESRVGANCTGMFTCGAMALRLVRPCRK